MKGAEIQLPTNSQTFDQTLYSVNTTEIPDKLNTNVVEDSYYYFDYVNMNYPGEFKHVSLWEMSAKITLYSIIILGAMIGNALIVVVVMRNKKMQSTTNFFIVNLAVADILVTVCCTWVHLVNNLTEGWVLGNFFCKVNSFAQGTFMFIFYIYMIYTRLPPPPCFKVFFF